MIFYAVYFYFLGMTRILIWILNELSNSLPHLGRRGVDRPALANEARVSLLPLLCMYHLNCDSPVAKSTIRSISYRIEAHRVVFIRDEFVSINR